MPPLPTLPVHSTLLGIYAKLVSLVLFSTMDALVKWLGDSYGPFQLMLFRSGIAMVPLFVLIARSGGLKVVRSNRPWMQAGRICAGFASLLGFFYVFPRMPLVDVYAISFAAPLFMVALSVPLLGETVGVRRWCAVAVGFAGVLIMLEPWNMSFHWLSLAVLAATFSYALSTVLVRRVSRYDHDAATIFWFSLIASSVSLVGAIPEWKAPTPLDWLLLCSLGLLGGLAQILVTRALRQAPASILAPFDYASIVFALLYGYVVFHEAPSTAVWYGLPLVIGSGLYVLHREQARSRGRRLAIANP